jgi:enoyl-CoA hydratase/carnithine racemase
MQMNIVVGRRERLAIIELHRPAKRNALTRASIDELRRTFQDLASTDVAAVLLHGGDYFCSGFDLDELRVAPLPLDVWVEAHRALAAIAAPVVVCLRGGAINAGAALALGADLLVASDSSYLQIKEAEMDMTPLVNSAWLGANHSTAAAHRLALTCEKVYGPELLRLGVATEVVSDADAFERSLHLATRLSSYPGAASVRTKGVLTAARGGRGFEAALENVRGAELRSG